MEHSFNAGIARIYGIREAVIIDYMLKSSANNADTSMHELFVCLSYMEEREIKKSVNYLVKHGLIIKYKSRDYKINNTDSFYFSELGKDVIYEFYNVRLK